MNDDDLHDALMEMSARISANRFLLEQLYANTFLNDLAGFDRFLVGAMDLTRTSSTAAQPTSADDMAELTARVSVHLERFGAATRQRIAKPRP